MKSRIEFLIIVLLTPILIISPGSAQEESAISCHEREEFPVDILPENIRLVVGYEEYDHLFLINPHDKTIVSIPHTWDIRYSGIPLLFDSDSRMMVVRNTAPGQWLWQTSNLNGSSRRVVRVAPGRHPVATERSESVAASRSTG